jgi:hypothetical protein
VERRGRLAALWSGIGTLLATTSLSGSAEPDPDRASVVAVEIPAFARKYKTSCSTCHTTAPKLNVLGEAFRLNGYRFPENDQLLRRDEPVPLGAEPWKEEWPRAIWPGELPGDVPLAVRVTTDVQYTAADDAEVKWNFRFPEEVALLAGSTLGKSISAFMTVEWNPEEGVEVEQAKVQFQNLLPWFPERSLNLWVGLQPLYALTFVDSEIDRAARLEFRWQTYSASDLVLSNPGSGETLVSGNHFQLGNSQPTLEMNGLGIGRLYYGVGVGQGGGRLGGDNNNRKDLYYKLRYKFGGLSLAGRYRSGDGPATGSGGQLLDRALILEHFGYFGAEPVEGGVQDNHRSFGVSARTLLGAADAGVGYVWRVNENPWGTLQSGSLSTSSFFARAEYLAFPWLIGSLKFDTFDVRVPEEARQSGFAKGDLDQTRILPGLIMLIRQNVRVVMEAELFTDHARSSESGQAKPHSLWFRLDVAF